ELDEAGFGFERDDFVGDSGDGLGERSGSRARVQDTSVHIRSRAVDYPARVVAAGFDVLEDVIEIRCVVLFDHVAPAIVAAMSSPLTPLVNTVVGPDPAVASSRVPSSQHAITSGHRRGVASGNAAAT